MPSLTLRQLNRALLARQHLIARSDLPVRRMVELLAGLNAQDPQQPYISLWSRLSGFDRRALDAALNQREIVKGMLMRSTLHIVSGRDYVRIRRPLQPVLSRSYRGFFREQSERLPLEQVVEVARGFAFGGPRTLPEFRDHLLRAAPEEDGAGLLYLVRSHLPLLQLPPDGTWGAYGTPTWTLPEHWLGRSVEQFARWGERRLVLRYLRAFGPASESDLTAWAGRSLSEAVAGLQDHLVKYEGPDGRVLLDLPGMPVPAPDTPVPVRFLPVWDNALLSHKDRSRILPEQYRSRAILSGGRVQPSFLVDGFVAGLWRLVPSDQRVQLVLEPFTALSAPVEAELLKEAQALVSFLTGGSRPGEVVLAPTAPTETSTPD